jgi:hypothetical protein
VGDKGIGGGDEAPRMFDNGISKEICSMKMELFLRGTVFLRIFFVVERKRILKKILISWNHRDRINYFDYAGIKIHSFGISEILAPFFIH